ncbi:unnamed protein product [Discula destructiva]
MISKTISLALLSLTAVSSAVIKNDLSNGPFRGTLLHRAFNLDPRQDTGIAAVTQSIDSIGTSIALTNNSVVAFDGGIAGLIDVNEAVVNLGTNLSAATTVMQGTSALSPMDSANVGIAFLFLQPNINMLLQNLNSKQSLLDGAGFGLLDTRSLIHDTLALQQNGSKALGDSLINILDPTIQGIGRPVNDQIQGNFTAAVAAWEGRSGVIKIPTSFVPTATSLLASIGPFIESFLGSLGGLGGGNETTPGTAKREDTADFGEGRVGAVSPPAQDSKYCCGITQERIDALGSDENDLAGVPMPIVVALRVAGVID